MKKMAAILSVLALVLVSNVWAAHSHKAPHGGALIALGDHVAHMELIISAESGRVTAFILDAHAEKAVRIAAKEIEIKVLKEGFSFKVTPVTNELSGEKDGDTSEFGGQSDKLKGLKVFDAEVVVVTAKGREFKSVKFNYPKGNE